MTPYANVLLISEPFGHSVSIANMTPIAIPTAIADHQRINFRYLNIRKVGRATKMTAKTETWSPTINRDRKYSALPDVLSPQERMITNAVETMAATKKPRIVETDSFIIIPVSLMTATTYQTINLILPRLFSSIIAPR